MDLTFRRKKGRREETAFCVKDRDGKVLARGKVATDPEALFEALKEHCLCPERIVMETGTLSHWLVRELRALGLPGWAKMAGKSYFSVSVAFFEVPSRYVG